MGADFGAHGLKSADTIQSQVRVNDTVSPKNGGQINMKDATQRSIFRWIHIVFAIPILGYIYSPFEKLPDYAPATRFVFLPVMVLTGLWMWKGHGLRRLISKRSAQQDAAGNA
jgi:hypothetical protein